MPRIILDRAFERQIGGFDHRTIECEIMDTKFGPIAYARKGVWLSNAAANSHCVIEAGTEVEMTDGEILDAQKILDRVK